MLSITNLKQISEMGNTVKKSSTLLEELNSLFIEKQLLYILQQYYEPYVFQQLYQVDIIKTTSNYDERFISIMNNPGELLNVDSKMEFNLDGIEVIFKREHHIDTNFNFYSNNNISTDKLDVHIFNGLHRLTSFGEMPSDSLFIKNYNLFFVKYNKNALFVYIFDDYSLCQIYFIYISKHFTYNNIICTNIIENRNNKYLSKSFNGDKLIINIKKITKFPFVSRSTQLYDFILDI